MIGPTRKLDDITKIEAICIDLDIPFDTDFYILLHNFAKEHDPEETLGAALFDEQNRQYVESMLGNIKTGKCTAKNTYALAKELSPEWNDKRPLVQLSYMFSDPEYRAHKFQIYQEKILPKMNECDWYEAYKTIAKKEGTEEKEEGDEDIEDAVKEYDAAEKSRNTETDETEYLGDLMD